MILLDFNISLTGGVAIAEVFRRLPNKRENRSKFKFMHFNIVDKKIALSHGIEFSL